MQTNNYNVNRAIENTPHGVFLLVHINNKRVMKANVSNMSLKSREYMADKIVRAIHTTLEVK